MYDGQLLSCRTVNNCPKVTIWGNELELVHQFSHLSNILDDSKEMLAVF